ncbi:MAG TPA: ATP-binding protein, partial [Actinomycetota bacterium]|nr:ATP-binding protein [Actinomycetota bacterium]
TEVASEGKPTLHEQEAVVVTKDGNGLHLALTTSPVRNEFGDVTHAVTIVRDISDRVEAEARRVELEQQLHQSQKMEAIGRLASGVAHDFNNLLSVIINYANFLAEDLEPGSTASDDVQRIRQAGHSAVGLVRQLLLFSRKEAVEPQIVDPNQMVLGMETLLRRTLGEDIRLETRLATDLWLTKIDPGQMEQILMNLAVNARDAMPHGGTLFIDTSNVTTDEYFAGKTGADPGDYVRIAIGDDGPGMPPEVLSHIFEPFFTTKSEGEGTGLGLATVYAIVQGVQGCISVSSEAGVGTRFDIHLPATQEQQPALEEDEPAVAHRGEGQRILLVEDEEAVRELAARILSANGYEVLSARSGREALELCSELDGPLRLLLSDVIMPHMSGKELAGWLRQVKPGFATIFMSGYTDQAVGSRALGEDGVSFLQKPFTADRLLQEVHKVLSGRQPISSSG